MRAGEEVGRARDESKFNLTSQRPRLVVFAQLDKYEDSF